MEDFELSVKSRPDGTGAEGRLKGEPGDLITGFCVLANSLCKKTHFPPAALAMLVAQCREITEKTTKDHVTIDLGALGRSAAEQ